MVDNIYVKQTYEIQDGYFKLLLNEKFESSSLYNLVQSSVHCPGKILIYLC